MRRILANLIPLVLAVAAGVAVALWWRGPAPVVPQRTPLDSAAGAVAATQALNPAASGKLTTGPGVLALAPAPQPTAEDWPRFRGSEYDGIAHAAGHLARSWPAGGPKVLWSAAVGDGYAGPAVSQGRVFLIDYDLATQSDVVRCMSLSDGRDIWRYSYRVKIKPNHRITRTTPAVTDRFLVTIGPKCHVVCLNPQDGQFLWAKDLASDFGATVPEWYAGQCPMIDGDRVILATGGPDLLVALDAASGKVVWRSPNPRQWKMTHSSIMPMMLGGKRTYVYCGSGGVAGVSAEDGAILWDTTDWRISIATVAAPVVIGDDRVLLAGGYGSGSMMIQIVPDGDHWQARTLWRRKPELFGATQQTPILYDGYLYGVRPEPDNRLVCLSLDGKEVWSSTPDATFGLGPFLIADGLILAMNDNGTLTAAEATPTSYHQLAKAAVLTGPESWGPMALVGTRLLVRDATHLVCLSLAESGQ
jgi:outer membrane protein assembly factor BamB